MKQFTLILFITISTSVSWAQKLKNDVKIEQLGISFEIPEGWTGKMEEDYIFLGHESMPGIMVLFENTSTSTEDLRCVAMEGIEEEGIHLKPKENFKVISERRVEGMYTGNFNGTQVLGYAIGLLNEKGSGMSVLALTATDTFTNAHKIEANKLISSVQFYEAVEDKKVSFWKQRIIGSRLIYMNSYYSSDIDGGYVGSNRTITIDLCSNSHFYYYNEGLISVDTGFNENPNAIAGSYDQKNNLGAYEIYLSEKIPYLDLNFANGEQRTYQLALDENDIPLLNGNKYYIDTLENCQ